MPQLEKHREFSGERDQPSFVQSVIAYFRRWRYDAGGVVLCFLAMYLGWIGLAGGFSVLDAVSAVGFATASATCILLAIFLINDAADRDIDRLVHPERPIPLGLSNWKHIYLTGIILAAMALVLAAFVNLGFLQAVALQISLVLLYYSYFKRHLAIPASSELIAPLISAMFPITAFTVAPAFRGDLLLAVVCFIYFADLAQDILGGIHDEAGDRQYNVRTFAVAISGTTARWISAMLFLLAVAAGFAVAIHGQLGWVYLASFGILTALMLQQYVRVSRAGRDTLPAAAGAANHLGGLYFFVISASILPDLLIRNWHN
jgi:4-hydroxybenzoate polyprenyltransferase